MYACIKGYEWPCKSLKIIIKIGHCWKTWWRDQMETFSVLMAIFAGNSPVTGEFPAHKGQWRGALMSSLICARINGWVNNRGAGDLRPHCAHYDVTIMDASSTNRSHVIYINICGEGHQTVSLNGHSTDPWCAWSKAVTSHQWECAYIQ